MLTGEGRLTCVISSRRRMGRTLTALSSPCRAWRKIDSFSLLLVHDNLFSHDHSPTSYDLLITYPDSVLFGLAPTVQICLARGHVNLRQNHTASFQIAYPAYLSVFGRVHRTNLPGSTLATFLDVDCADNSLISAVELRGGCTAVGGFLKFCELSPCDFDHVSRLWEEGVP